MLYISTLHQFTTFCCLNKSPTIKNAHNPVFDYVFDIDVISIQSDLHVDIWEDNSYRSSIVGQVVIPLSSLLDLQSIISPSRTKRRTDGASSINDWSSQKDGKDEPFLVSSTYWYELFPVSYN